jgi:trans-aconitate 2-methyltransferase
MIWDANQYLRFAAERALPFHHLVASVAHLEPRSVVDLGCGPGGLTASLLERWPAARIIGIDNSEEMIAHARRREVPGRLEFEIADIRTWTAPNPVDLMLANASFHWIDDHGSLFDHLLPQISPGGTLACQVPANYGEPSHTLLRELCSSPRWRDRLAGQSRTGVRDLQWYVDELGVRGLHVNAWQTTYFHILEGADPVLEWLRGTTLRPILERLADDEHGEFLAEYGAVLGQAYPKRDGKTVFPFRRTFVVARIHP